MTAPPMRPRTAPSQRTMAETFPPVIEHLKQVADSLIAANEAVQRLAKATLVARDEHEDTRESVRRLESLAVSQSQDLQAPRQELRARRNEVQTLRPGLESR